MNYDLILFNELVNGLDGEINVEMQRFDLSYDEDIVIFQLVNVAPREYVDTFEVHSYEYTIMIDIFTSGNRADSKARLISSKIDDIMLRNGARSVGSRPLPHYLGKSITRRGNTYRAHVTTDNVVY